LHHSQVLHHYSKTAKSNPGAACTPGEVCVRPNLGFCYSISQGCGVGSGVGVIRSRKFLGGVGVGFLTTLGVGFVCPTPTPDVQLYHFLHHTPYLRSPVEMIQILFKLLLSQRFHVVHQDFHWF